MCRCRYPLFGGANAPKCWACTARNVHQYMLVSLENWVCFLLHVSRSCRCLWFRDIGWSNERNYSCLPGRSWRRQFWYILVCRKRCGSLQWLLPILWCRISLWNIKMASQRIFKLPRMGLFALSWKWTEWLLCTVWRSQYLYPSLMKQVLRAKCSLSSAWKALAHVLILPNESLWICA